MLFSFFGGGSVVNVLMENRVVPLKRCLYGHII